MSRDLELRGGPLDGQTVLVDWDWVSWVDVAVHCACDAFLCLDTARYDAHDGSFIEVLCRHQPVELKFCDCSLCPGHQVAVGDPISHQPVGEASDG